LNVSKLQIEDSPGYLDWESGVLGLGVLVHKTGSPST